MDRKNHGRFCGSLLFLAVIGCAREADDVLLLSRRDGLPVGEACGLAEILAYPVPQADYLPGSYAGRRFGNPDDHLGEDVFLPEGTPVRAIASGTIKVYRAALGYGELVAVVEHDFGQEISFRNGNGEIVGTRYALSIYGHLRRSQTRGGSELGWEEGDCLEAGEVIGYVNDDRHNGDGDTHLHAGFRLASAADAAAADESWFRGYDEDGRWRGDFAAMSEAISGIIITVSHHPDGALLKRDGNPDIYLVEGGQKRLIRDETVWRAERFWVAGHPEGEWHKVAIVSAEELDCYPEGSEMAEGVRRRLIRCPDGDFLWREDNNNRQRIPVNDGTRGYGELVRSWGFGEDEIERDEQFCGAEASFDPLYLRDGTLVREDDRSDVYFITAHGAARPIESWDLLVAMGYQADDIQWLPAGALSSVVREIQRDQVIGWDEARDCLVAAGDRGGGGVGCSPAEETCNGLDDDCDGEADEGVLNACGLCESVPSEVCDGADNDCDGVADDGIVCDPGVDGGGADGGSGLHEVRIRFCPGEDGFLETDLPDLGGWYSYAIANGCADVSFRDVRDNLYRMNGEYQNATAWECNEWPRDTIWLRNGEVPQAWVDGVEVEVIYGHEERLDVGCNFFLTVD